MVHTEQREIRDKVMINVRIEKGGSEDNKNEGEMLNKRDKQM